ncbi:hypothetical protein HK405_006476, partial [Cladochytrium tenue]
PADFGPYHPAGLPTMASHDEAGAFQQYEAIRLYLDQYLQSQRGAAASQQRESAIEKMTRLTKQQFFDLSTDVYDEMNRRQMNSNEGATDRLEPYSLAITLS